MLGGHILQHPGALFAVALEGVLDHPHGILGGNFLGAIAATGVHHNDVIGQERRLNTGGNIPFFVVGEDIDGEH